MRSRKKNWVRRWAVRASLATLISVALWLLFLWPTISGLLTLDETHRGWTFPSTIYSDWLTLQPAKPISPEQIVRHLKRAGYTPSPSESPNPGTYLRQRNALVIHARATFIPDHTDTYESERFLRITGEAKIDKLETSPEGVRWTTVETARLEPVPLARLYDQSLENREFIRPERIPGHLKDAVVAVEDRRFFTHGGLDPRGMARAVWEDLRRGRITQGGSTITQQLAKNIFLTRRRTLWRKLLEFGVAELIELRYSKEEILGLYLNQVYLGQDGSVSVSGVEAGAKYYFGRPASSLDLPECALLAGLIRSAVLYSPLLSPGRARDRRNFVLERMRQEGFISPRDAEEARARPLGLSLSRSRTDSGNLYFVDEVHNQLMNRYSQLADGLKETGELPESVPQL